ncbi:MAG: hypothetical protein Q9159_006666 [Coniocarpon cinnabarinum]
MRKEPRSAAESVVELEEARMPKINAQAPLLTCLMGVRAVARRACVAELDQHQQQHGGAVWEGSMLNTAPDKEMGILGSAAPMAGPGMVGGGGGGEQ